MKQKEKRNREEPSLDQTEELDVVEAFKTCHTSSKRGLTDPAREALVSSFVCFIHCIFLTSYKATQLISFYQCSIGYYFIIIISSW